jgi:hypothetical protein
VVVVAGLLVHKILGTAVMEVMAVAVLVRWALQPTL